MSQNAGRAATRSKAATSCGSNQAPDRFRASRSAASGPLATWNTSMTCAISAMRDKSGFPRRAGPGLAAAVPMLVEILDAIGDGFGETHLAGNVGAAMAARLYQFARDLAAVLEDLTIARNRSARPGFEAGMAQHEAQRLRQAAVDELEVLLEGEIIGQIQLADARRIAAAAKILQQQRVIEFRDLVLSRPISRPISTPIRLHRTQWPAGWPSVRSSAWLSALSSSESVILSNCPGASGVGSMVEAPGQLRAGRNGRITSPKPHQIMRGLTEGVWDNHYRGLTPSTDTFAVVCSEGQMTSVRPVATATRCCPLVSYVITPPPMAPPIFCPHNSLPVSASSA